MGLWRYAFIAALLLAAPIARADPLAQAVSATGAEPQRLALVIGNADYNLDGKLDTPQDASRAGGFAVDLPNTRNDASDMKDALERLHFTVIGRRSTPPSRTHEASPSLPSSDRR